MEVNRLETLIFLVEQLGWRGQSPAPQTAHFVERGQFPVKRFMQERMEKKMSETVRWLSYDFLVFDYHRLWPDIGGNYVFAKFDPFAGWSRPFYTGQTHSFQERFSLTYENWLQAAELGANRVCAMVVEQAVLRVAIEAALIQAYQPILNTQQPSLPKISFPWDSRSYKLPWE